MASVMNEPIESELMSCPFCGGDGVLKNYEEEYFVQCKDVCPVRPTTALYKYYDSIDEAIKAWNTRHTDKRIDGWISVEEAPMPLGKWLVELEDNSLHVAKKRENITVVGNLFHFDMPKIIRYIPLPTPPKEINKD